jgi:hypothetical protein
MARFYQINLPEDYNEWMTLLTNSEMYSQRAKELKDYSEAINAALAQYEQHKKAEDAVSDANVKLKEADAIRKQADDYAASLKAKAEKEFKEKAKSMDTAQMGLRSVSEHLDRRDAETKLREVALDTRQASLDKLAALIKEEAANAKSQLAEALKLKATYEDKLQQLKAAIGE